MILRKYKLDPNDYDLVLASDLYNETEGYYDLTLKQAIDEQVPEGETIEYIQYDLKKGQFQTNLLELLAYTQSRIIFSIIGLNIQDALLTHLPRNPPK